MESTPVPPGSFLIHEGSNRQCIGDGYGQCGSMRVLGPPPKPIGGLNIFSSRDKQGYLWLLICRHKWDWIRIILWPPVKLEKSVYPSTRFVTWKPSSKAFHSTASRHP